MAVKTKAAAKAPVKKKAVRKPPTKPAREEFSGKSYLTDSGGFEVEPAKNPIVVESVRVVIGDNGAVLVLNDQPFSLNPQTLRAVTGELKAASVATPT